MNFNNARRRLRGSMAEHQARILALLVEPRSTSDIAEQTGLKQRRVQRCLTLLRDREVELVCESGRIPQWRRIKKTGRRQGARPVGAPYAKGYAGWGQW